MESVDDECEGSRCLCVFGACDGAFGPASVWISDVAEALDVDQPTSPEVSCARFVTEIASRT